MSLTFKSTSLLLGLASLLKAGADSQYAASLESACTGRTVQDIVSLAQNYVDLLYGIDDEENSPEKLTAVDAMCKAVNGEASFLLDPDDPTTNIICVAPAIVACFTDTECASSDAASALVTVASEACIVFDSWGCSPDSCRVMVAPSSASSSLLEDATSAHAAEFASNEEEERSSEDAVAAKSPGRAQRQLTEGAPAPLGSSLAYVTMISSAGLVALAAVVVQTTRLVRSDKHKPATASPCGNNDDAAGESAAAGFTDAVIIPADV